MKHKFAIKLLLLLSSSLSTMCTGVISPAIPLMSKAFSDVENVKILLKLMVVLPNLFIAISSPLIGMLSSRIKNKRFVLFAGLVVYAIFGSSGFYLKDLYHILFARIFVGISIACIMTSATAMIAEYFTDTHERSLIVGLQSMTMSIGSVVYTMLSGVLADINWRYIFLIYLSAAVILPFAILFLFEPSKEKSKENPDIFQNQFILQNNYLITAICLINMCIMVMFYLIKLQLPFIVYNMPNMNAKSVATALCVETLFAAIFSAKYKRVKKNRDFAVMCSMGFAIFAFSYIMISLSKSYTHILFGMAICGVGMGFLMPNAILWIIGITRPKNRNIVIGWYTTATFLGKFLSPVLMTPLTKIVSVKNSFFVCAVIMLFMSILLMFLNDYLSRINRVKLRKIINRARREGYKLKT